MVGGGYAPTAAFVGIAPDANVNAVNISRPDGVRSSDVMAALLWVLANHKGANIDVVNLSLTETSTSSYLASPLDAVVEKLWSAGVVVVVSSGNKGPGTTSLARQRPVRHLGRRDRHDGGSRARRRGRVVLVERRNARRRSRSPRSWLRAGASARLLPAGTTLDGQAPATSRLEPGYVRMSGTSFSAPQVAGAAALMLQANPKLTPDQVKAILLATTDPVSGSPAGTLDIPAALALASTPPVNATQGWQPARWSASPPPAPMSAPPAPASPDMTYIKNFAVSARAVSGTLSGRPQGCRRPHLRSV